MIIANRSKDIQTTIRTLVILPLQQILNFTIVGQLVSNQHSAYLMSAPHPIYRLKDAIPPAHPLERSMVMHLLYHHHPLYRLPLYPTILSTPCFLILK